MVDGFQHVPTATSHPTATPLRGSNSYLFRSACSLFFLLRSALHLTWRPTAFKQIRAGSGSVPQGETRLVVHALRDLDVGEAISISYIPEARSESARVSWWVRSWRAGSELWEAWGGREGGRETEREI